MLSNSQWEKIYLDLQPTIINYLQTVLNLDYPTSCDIYSECMLRLRTAYTHGKALNFAVEIAKNLARDYYRRRSVELRNQETVPRPMPEEDPLDLIISRDTRREIHRQFLLGLTGRNFTVVKLYLDGHAIHDIAATVGMGTSTIYSILRGL